MNIMSINNTSQKLHQLLAERDASLRPIWVRAPKSGQTEFYSWLSRGKLYQAESMGLIKTASLKPPGAIRGVKLFHLESLLKYVESCTTPAPSSILPQAAVPIDAPRVTETRQTKSTSSERKSKQIHL